jgi:hypothetical protein
MTFHRREFLVAVICAIMRCVRLVQRRAREWRKQPDALGY